MHVHMISCMYACVYTWSRWPALQQAAGEIVEFALQRRLPFAVVPCCVFPRTFPDRRLVDEGGGSKHVVTTADFIEYLQRKPSVERGLPRAEKAYLAHAGKNCVVFGGWGGRADDKEPAAAPPARRSLMADAARFYSSAAAGGRATAAAGPAAGPAIGASLARGRALEASRSDIFGHNVAGRGHWSVGPSVAPRHPAPPQT